MVCGVSSPRAARSPRRAPRAAAGPPARRPPQRPRPCPPAAASARRQAGAAARAAAAEAAPAARPWAAAAAASSPCAHRGGRMHGSRTRAKARRKATQGRGPAVTRDLRGARCLTAAAVCGVDARQGGRRARRNAPRAAGRRRHVGPVPQVHHAGQRQRGGRQRRGAAARAVRHGAGDAGGPSVHSQHLRESPSHDPRGPSFPRRCS